jgi:putative tricarboxylic transport membrane protein
MADIFINLWHGMIYAVSLSHILAIIIGYAIGVVAGAIPGVMAVTAMVLILPFTFTLEPLFAIALLMGTYKGGGVCWIHNRHPGQHPRHTRGSCHRP